jgi:hypothetical protein
MLTETLLKLPFSATKSDKTESGEERNQFALSLQGRPLQIFSKNRTGVQESRDGILERQLLEVSGHNLESSQTRVLSGFLPSLMFYKMSLKNILEFS